MRTRGVFAGLSFWLASTLTYAQTIAPVSMNELDARLAQEARLEWIERVALAGQPSLAESRARALAAEERATGAARLPDLEFKYEQWAVPLNRPYALNRADTVMFGLRQAFPAPGTRQARERIANEEAHMFSGQTRVATRDLMVRVRRAFFEYYVADRVLRLHLEHVGVAEQIVAQVRANYEVGRGDQQDVLKVLVELSRLHNDLAEIRQQRESSRLLLNALMARTPQAPLGPPSEPSLSGAAPSVAELEKEQATGRPELELARRAIRRSEETLSLARSAARRPSFVVGADYWLMPTENMPHAYGAMVMMSLPWLNGARRADVREAERLLAADRHAAEATHNTTAFQLHDAVARLDAARTSFEAIDRSVLPQAEKSMVATRSAFAVGQSSLLSLLDSLRAYFEVRLEHSRAWSRVMTELANVDFASGGRVIPTPSIVEDKP
ncbi:MAG: TolC family protein [Myxococcales bacterium]